MSEGESGGQSCRGLEGMSGGLAGVVDDVDFYFGDFLSLAARSRVELQKL
jgi:hypothetical protein